MFLPDDSLSTTSSTSSSRDTTAYVKVDFNVLRAGANDNDASGANVGGAYLGMLLSIVH